MSSRLFLYTLATVIAAASFMLAQSRGRLEEPKRQGLTYLKNYSFDKAAAKLEEVWEQDQSDPAVAEGLAIAYLNGEDRDYQPGVALKAFAMMRAALESGGQATFLAVHSHERMGWIQGRKANQFCTGRLTIERGRIYFVSENREKPAEHSFDLKPEQIEELKPLSGGNASGAFALKTRDKTYNMFPRNWKALDRDTLLSFTETYVGIKLTQP